MGCCEDLSNIIGIKNKDLSNSFRLKGIKERNLRIENNDNSYLMDNKALNHILNKNHISKIKLDIYRKNKTLDKINEVDSEYNESSLNTRLISREKISPSNKNKIINNCIKNNLANEKLGKIKTLRRNRSQPEFKIILSEENFNKKLNEYNNNNINYNHSLKKVNYSRNDINNNLIFAKSLVNFSFKDNKIIAISEGNNKTIINNSKNKFINEIQNNIIRQKEAIINQSLPNS